MPTVTGIVDVADYERKEIRMILRNEITVPVVLAPSTTGYEAGRVLGQLTANKQFTNYDNSKTDGTELARVILTMPVEASTLPVNAEAYASGVFYKDSLIGLDANAITDLGAREPITNMLIVPGC